MDALGVVRTAELIAALAAAGDPELRFWGEVVKVDRATGQILPARIVASVALA